MLASAFVSYIGAFDQKFRNMLWNEIWLADLTDKQIATTSESGIVKLVACVFQYHNIKPIPTTEIFKTEHE